MLPPYFPFVIPRPVVMLVIGYKNNRLQRRKRIYGKGGKSVREWGL